MTGVSQQNKMYVVGLVCSNMSLLHIARPEKNTGNVYHSECDSNARDALSTAKLYGYTSESCYV